MKSLCAKTRLSLLVACIYTVHFHVSNILDFTVLETRAKFLSGIFGRLHNNNNNLHLYSANLYMNIFGCALQYCYIKFILKVTKA